MTVEDMVVSWVQLEHIGMEDRHLPEGIVTAFVWVRRQIEGGATENILVTRAWYDKFQPRGQMRPALTAEDCMQILFIDRPTQNSVPIDRSLYNNTSNSLVQVLWPETSGILHRRIGDRRPEQVRPNQGIPRYVFEEGPSPYGSGPDTL